MAALIYLLKERKITLLDPQSWDDRNDSHYLMLYREKKKLRSVLALCFTQASETYHHWRVFANGSSGICISFKRSQLLRAVKSHEGLRTGSVEYLTLRQVQQKELTVQELPFLKRYPFEDEMEFRMIYESNEWLSSLDIAIPLSCVDRVTLSPWVHDALWPYIEQTLNAIKGCSELKIVRSTLISNDRWKSFGEKAGERPERTTRAR
jgi:hypothetical protein